MEEFDKLLKIAKRKTQFDEKGTWSKGSQSYLAGIKNEVDEVIEETPKSRQCYLEDELGDILWNYLNVLTTMEKETGIEPKAVLIRACRKYEARVSAIESGIKWSEIKEQQNIALAIEYSSKP